VLVQLQEHVYAMLPATMHLLLSVSCLGGDSRTCAALVSHGVHALCTSATKLCECS
jgi:hypothetical protein